MKKLIIGIVSLILAFLVVAVLVYDEADYTIDSLLVAMDNGDNVSGKTVKCVVTDLAEHPVIGYGLYTDSDELVFTSTLPLNVNVGDEVIITIDDYKNLLGVYTVSIVQ